MAGHLARVPVGVPADSGEEAASAAEAAGSAAEEAAVEVEAEVGRVETPITNDQ